MVEVTQTMFRRILIYALGAVFLTAGGVRAQQPEVEARIAGLEGNAEYMSLLREDAQLQIREDSIVNAVERMRRQLREDPGKRQQYSQEILQLESRIFEIRNAKGRLIDRINTIEQEWVLASLNGAAQQPAASAEKSPAEAVPDSLKVRNLVDNLYFREHLPAEDYAALRDAQRQEMRAVDYVNRYFANHGTLTELAETYAAVQTEAEAMEVFERYNALQGVNRALADSLAATWNSIFDNKSYAYGYLLDKMGEEEVLVREEEALSEASRQLSALQGETASDAVADYFLRKRVVVDYEAAVAGVLALDAARDSLRGVAAQLESIDYRLPRVEVAERYFLDYDSVAFSSKPVYSYQNPIPECRVYANGTIYRILLGTFNTKRAAATFRGAYPLFYLINDEGKWCPRHAGRGRGGAGAAEKARVRAARNRGVDRRRGPQPFARPRGGESHLPRRDHRDRRPVGRSEGGDRRNGRRLRTFARGQPALRRGGFRRPGRRRPSGRVDTANGCRTGGKSRRNRRINRNPDEIYRRIRPDSEFFTYLYCNIPQALWRCSILYCSFFSACCFWWPNWSCCPGCRSGPCWRWSATAVRCSSPFVISVP